MRRRRATLPPVFHVGLHTVHACESSPLALAAVLGYLHRRNESDVRDRCALVDVESYMLRLKQHLEAKAAVFGHRFFCHGSISEDEVWAGIDKAARTKSGRYHRRAGGKPRLAILGELSLPWDLPEAEKVRLSHAIAQKIVDEYGAAVTCVCHLKVDQPENGIDHVHLLISMREVDAKGIGKMIRAFNGMASRRGSDERVVVGERTLAAFPVWLRQHWAELLTEATGVEHSPWSYADQGLDLKPCKNVSRAALEIDKRNGGILKAARKAAMAARNEAFLRRARTRVGRVEAPAPDLTFAERVIAAHPQLARCAAFSPMAKIAMLAKARVRSARRTDPSVDHSRRQPAAIAAPDHVERHPASTPRQAHAGGTSYVPTRSVPIAAAARPVVAVGPTASPSGVRDPKTVESTLISRQWDALYNNERQAAAQRNLEEREEPVKAARSASQPFSTRQPFLGRIVGEGGIGSTAASPNVPPRMLLGPASQPTNAAACAVAFGAALILSRWSTEDGEIELAAAIGWERSDFRRATEAKAADIEAAAESPTVVRAQARAGAPASLRDIFDRLEAERKAAKKKGDKERAARRQGIDNADPGDESTSSTHSEATASREKKADHSRESATETANKEAPTNSEGRQKLEPTVSRKSDLEPASKLLATGETTKIELGGAPVRNGAQGLDHVPFKPLDNSREDHAFRGHGVGEMQPSVQANGQDPGARPLFSRQQISEIVLDLAALLSRCGLLHSHVQAVCDLCATTQEFVFKEVNLRLQTFAQVKDRMSEATAKILSRAAALNEPKIDLMISAMSSASRQQGALRSKSVERSPKQTDRNKST